MTDPILRVEQCEDLVKRFASAIRAMQLYAPTHPLVARSVDGLLEALRQFHASRPTVTIGILADQLVVEEIPLIRASGGLIELVRRLATGGVERIVIDRGVAAEELIAFLQAVSALKSMKAAGAPDPARPDETWTAPTLPHIRIGRLALERQTSLPAGDATSIRRLYNEAVAAAQALWDGASLEGRVELIVARGMVENLAEAVSENRTAVMALTAMKNYDNYTFTHMVNVSILTMAQARGLGIEGRLLREFGLSGLMHDIGKVRTPLDVLNKPDKLNDAEFTILKRHTVEGAEILRGTPEMPVLGPVVAFEHHLRLDGTGYPEGVRRPTLNLGTMLCGIADVYDAMRSKRVYQQSFPTDRILAVLQRNDGKQFDQHLVKRFVQLIGIYPPGNLVRLSTGELALVVRVHAPDPFRPAVRVLFDRMGQRLETPHDRNLWEPDPERGDVSVVSPVDPAEHGIDPLELL